MIVSASWFETRARSALLTMRSFLRRSNPAELARRSLDWWDTRDEKPRSRYRQAGGRTRQQAARREDHRRHLARRARRRDPVPGRRKRIATIRHLADGDGP